MDIKLAQQRFRIDKRHTAKWRKLAKTWFDFYAGEQWEAEDRAYLIEHLRPVITFNRTAIVVNAVAGSEIQSRPAITYSPIEPGDAQPNNVLQGGGDWFREVGEADFADSEAFLHTCICGMGWTETLIEFDEDPQGKPTVSCVDPLEMYWDAAARAPCLTDSRRFWRVVEKDVDEAERMFPGKKAADLHADWAGIPTSGGTAVDQNRADLYQDDDTNADTANDDKSGRTTVLIIQCQYIDYVKKMYVRDPKTGKEMFLDPDKFEAMNERLMQMGMPPLEGAPVNRKQWMQAFYGKDLLDKPTPLPVDQFTLKCITGYKHHTQGTWYGMIATMMDPQRWANKWLSQILHILNSNAKGGVAIERTAVEDAKQFETSWNKSDEVTWLNPGGKDKILPKVSQSPAAGFFNLMEFAITSIRDAAGVNLEQLGQRGAIQSASLEQERKQAGTAILAPMLDSLRHYRLSHGKMVVQFIKKYMADGTRLIRIVGTSNAKYVPLALNQDVDYDVRIDENPSGPDIKKQVWAFISPILDRIPPQVLISLLPYSPLPSSIVASVQEALTQAMQPDPALEQAKQLDNAQKQADIGMTQASAAKTMAEAELAKMNTKDTDLQGRLDISKFIHEELMAQPEELGGKNAK